MQFTNINIFSIFIFIIIIGIIVFLAYKKYFSQTNFNKKYKLLASKNTFYIKYLFLVLSINILLFGIFGIKYYGDNKQIENKGIDMMFVLDVSKSMNVADITDNKYHYTRLEIAKKAISDYVIKNTNNRYGLVIFAGDAISTIPLTTDTDLFLTMLSGVDYRNLILQGSDFEKALDLAISRFIGEKNKSKALVFISDGGDIGDNVDINLANINDITFVIIGVGTEIGGKIIKAIDNFGRYIFQKYKGSYAISKLNSNNLKNISNKLNGNYFQLEKTSDLEKLNKYFSKLEKKVINKNNNKNLDSFSRILTIISFILFIIFMFIYIFENKIFLKKRNI